MRKYFKGGNLFMCKFCKPEKIGDGKEIVRSLKDKQVRVGNLWNAMNLEAWILTKSDSKPKIQLSLTNQEGYDMATINIPIRYCPKCGRKL